MQKLTDGTITLRPFTIEDSEEHLEGEYKEQAQWLSGGKSTLEGMRNWITKNKQYWDNNGPVFNFAIVKDENKGLFVNHEDPEFVKYLYARNKKD
jgi:hypothetical protein